MQRGAKRSRRGRWWRRGSCRGHSSSPSLFLCLLLSLSVYRFFHLSFSLQRAPPHSITPLIFLSCPLSLSLPLSLSPSPSLSLSFSLSLTCDAYLTGVP